MDPSRLIPYGMPIPGLLYIRDVVTNFDGEWNNTIMRPEYVEPVDVWATCERKFKFSVFDVQHELRHTSIYDLLLTCCDYASYLIVKPLSFKNNSLHSVD